MKLRRGSETGRNWKQKGISSPIIGPVRNIRDKYTGKTIIFQATVDGQICYFIWSFPYCSRIPPFSLLFPHQRHSVAFLLLSFGGHRVYRIPFWWVMRWQLQLGWRQACLSEKNNLCHRDLEHWGCDEAPTCHHREARKKAVFLFYKVSLDSLQKQHPGHAVWWWLWLWEVYWMGW